MKKFATLAALATISATTAAQSSVTLYGALDVGIRDVKNGDLSVKSLSSPGELSVRSSPGRVSAVSGCRSGAGARVVA